MGAIPHSEDRNPNDTTDPYAFAADSFHRKYHLEGLLGGGE
jgi:hypothetical protein